jgi:hypothetical protein
MNEQQQRAIANTIPGLLCHFYARGCEERILYMKNYAPQRTSQRTNPTGIVGQRFLESLINPEDNSTNLIYRFADTISSPYSLFADKEALYFNFCGQLFSSKNIGFLQSLLFFFHLKQKMELIMYKLYISVEM